ncbi:DegT/DnrJ/EryC1/StrS family aminotransferase [Salinispira pacifica]|uniref:Putative aminotransferase, DegT family n=1 Tax=Salinispira pacifica TaxID=1307761 RepID=V5WFJ9_9SPIO|nr:DegT/DnrJ/EryC1/StrS family aminotransferase [Salinispira pacifica]AHC14548.1 Putative aminotransferase, DegT family [Salinispira pacifica]
MAIPVFRPSIKRKDMDAVLTCLVSDQLGPGSYGEGLVHDLLERIDADAGVLLRERLRGIELGFQALELKAGDRVAVSPLSDMGYYFVARRMGLEPVLIDVQESAPVMDFEILEKLHGENAFSALVLDHPLGFSPETETVSELNIPIFQDASNILSYQSDGGCIGDCILVSMEPENLITSGGGIFLASKTRKRSKLLNAAVEAYPQDIYLPDMNAALGGMQVKELKSFITSREELKSVVVQQAMQGRHRVLSSDDQIVPSYLALFLQSPMQDVIQYAVKKQVEIRPAFEKSVITSLLRDFDSGSEEGSSPAELYPQASSYSLRSVVLPLYPSLSRKELDIMLKVVKTLP